MQDSAMDQPVQAPSEGKNEKPIKEKSVLDSYKLPGHYQLEPSKNNSSSSSDSGSSGSDSSGDDDDDLGDIDLDAMDDGDEGGAKTYLKT